MINYLIESSVCLAVFYLVFLLFFRKDPYLVRNRFYLISSLILSLVIPLISFQPTAAIKEITDQFSVVTGQLKSQTIFEPVDQSGTNLWELAYWIGFFTSGIYLLVRLIVLFIKIGSFRKGQLHGEPVLFTEGNMPTSVFLKTLLWDNSNELQTAEQKAILAHEKAHIYQGHGYDLLFLEVLKVVFWFNPAIYLIDALVRQQHEFLSDQEASKQIDIDNYRDLIVNQLFISLNLSLTSNFGQPTVKKRLLMLKNKKISRFTKWKLLLVIPFVSILVFLYSCEQSNDPGLAGPVQVDNGSLFVKYEMTRIKHIVEWADGKSKVQIDPRYEGQGISIYGTVSGKSGPLPGASILLRGTTMGTVTNREGNFQFNIADAPTGSTLLVAFIDHKTFAINL